MENNKKKSRFNIIDAFVILLIAVLVFGIVYFIMMETGALPSSVSASNEKTVTYTVRISSVDEKYVSSFAAGDKALNSSTFESLGLITDIRTEKSVATSGLAVKTEDGGYELNQTEYEDKYDIYVTISTSADIDGRGIAYVGSERINVGSCVYFRCGNFAATSYVTDFKIG